MVELDDFKPAFTPAVAAEAIGMFLVTFLSSACAANAADNGLAAAALGTGFAFAMITYSTVHISGGHLNPAITAAYMAVGANGFTIREGISYMLAQFTGAICDFCLGIVLRKYNTNALLSEPDIKPDHGG